MKSYISCKNCIGGYEDVLEKCPYCFYSEIDPGKAVAIFDDITRSEISKLGGPLDDFVEININSSVVVPCGWGVVLFDRKYGFQWCFLAGLVRQVILNKDNTVFIDAGPGSALLDLKTGKIVKVE